VEEDGTLCELPRFCHNVSDILSVLHMPPQARGQAAKTREVLLTNFLVAPQADASDHGGRGEQNQLSDSDDDDVDDSKAKEKKVLGLISDISDSSGFQRKTVPEASSLPEGERKKKRAKVECVEQHCKAFSKCWISFLKLPLPLTIYKKVLIRLQVAHPALTSISVGTYCFVANGCSYCFVAETVGGYPMPSAALTAVGVSVR
jgi:hypothetical protein